MAFTDKTLACRDCGNQFTFTASEQEFYANKGFANEPRRCPACRSAQRGQRSGGGYNSGPRQMFDVTCSQCGKPAQVPFEPRGDRPVYCLDCFRAQKAA